MGKMIGIDLGTTNSAVAVWEDGTPHIIADAEGYGLTPSVVAHDPNTGAWLVGQAARSRLAHAPHATIASIKRFIGRRFHDERVQEALEKLHILYHVMETHQHLQPGAMAVEVGEMCLSPQEVSAKILRKLKQDAEAYLGHEVTQAVVTVPAYFHDSQRQATRDAGRIAGLEIKRVLNEPTAACLAIGHRRLMEERKPIAVYDLGGGTFDISILDVGRGPFRVRATSGDTFLGGDDLDWRIVEWMLNHLGWEHERLHAQKPLLARLWLAAEQAKIALSTEETTRIPLSELLDEADSDHDPVLTRAQLTELAKPLIQGTLEPCQRALRDARLDASDLHEIVLVGGQTRMPAIFQAVRDFFGKEPETGVNPEEVVALGAAVQAAILSGEETRIKLADVVPLTLGVKTRGEQMEAIIKRNTAVPIEKKRPFTTAYDNQESVEIQVYQGEHALVTGNEHLGSFVLTGIDPAPAEEPEIEVTFHVDENCILHVTGKDVRTGNYQEITITNSIRLSGEEIERMSRDGEVGGAGDVGWQARQSDSSEDDTTLAVS